MSAKYNLTFLETGDQPLLSECAGRSYFREKPVKVHEFYGAVFLPGKDGMGGLLVNDEYISDSFIRAGRWTDRSYPVREEEIVHFDGEVFYLGLFHDIWGHCITDNLKHLWCLLDTEWVKAHRDVKYAYSIIYGKRLPENFIWILEKLGIQRDKILQITHPTRFRKTYFADASFAYEDGCFTFTEQYRKTVEKIEEGIVPSDMDKVYLSRTKIRGSLFSFKKDYGEKNIENLFREQGFNIVYPEQLPVEQCISILKGADVIASTEGSVSHNSVFMKKGAVLVLLRKAQIVNWYQLAMNEVKDLDVTMIDVGKSSVFFDDECKAMGPFFVHVNANLRNYFQMPGTPSFPIFGYLRYSLWSRISKILRYIKLYIISRLHYER